MDSLDDAGKSMHFVTGETNIFKNNMQDVLSQFPKAIKGLFKAFDTRMMTGSVEKANEVLQKTITSVVDSGERIAKATNFSRGFEAGKVSLQELKDEVATYDLKTIIRQEQDLLDTVNFLNEASIKVVQVLRETGQVSLRTTIDGFTKTAELLGLTDEKLQELFQ